MSKYIFQVENLFSNIHSVGIISIAPGAPLRALKAHKKQQSVIPSLVLSSGDEF